MTSVCGQLTSLVVVEPRATRANPQLAEARFPSHPLAHECAACGQPWRSFGSTHWRRWRRGVRRWGLCGRGAALSFSCLQRLVPTSGLL